MATFEASRAMLLTNSQRENASAIFASASADPTETIRAMQWAQREAAQVIDPHTAVGLHASLTLAEQGIVERGVPIVTLATAHPAKFPDAVEAATGIRPPLPNRMADLYDRSERITRVDNDLTAIEDVIREKRAK